LEAGTVHLPIYPLQFVDAYLFDAAVRRVPNVAGASDEPALHLSAVSAHVQEEDRVLVATIGASVAVPYGSGNRLEIACQTSGCGFHGIPATRSTAFRPVNPWVSGHS
jgi:hypothetical protein